MTLNAFQIHIDPDPANWLTTSTGHWTHIPTGEKYDTTDSLQYKMDLYNAAAKATPGGDSIYIPGITPIPDAWKQGYVPPDEGRPPFDPGPNSRDDLPPFTGDNSAPPIHAGSGTGGLNRTNYLPGSTWNQPPPRPGGAPATGAPGFGGGLQWREPPSTGTGGPYRTGQALPFTPWGRQEALSSEILRYGGRPNSGAGGSWTSGPAPEMVSPFAPPKTTTGSAAGPMAPFSDAGFPSAPPSNPGPGDAYIDPTNRQGYVWRDGKWQKADLHSQLGGPGGYTDQTPPAGNIWVTGSPPPGTTAAQWAAMTTEQQRALIQAYALRNPTPPVTPPPSGGVT